MKIPQRDDQVQLNAPQTQAGRAVQPVEGSLGDSYLTAMRGMSKEFEKVSKLQFDLAGNAIQGQLDSFDIYVEARTKQYNNELSKATSQEQIYQLKGQYDLDIAETGTSMLGDELYTNWHKAKGGTVIAGAEYAANLGAAQLQIKLNNERLDNQLRELNTLAGTAETEEERNKYASQVETILQQNVENGTINQATALEKKENWNYNLAVSLVMKGIEDDPAEVAKKLRTDENFAPILTFPDRLRLAEQAEQISARREGTVHAKIEEKVIGIWQPMYDSDNAQVRGIAYQIKDMGQNLTQLKQWMSRVTGTPIKQISNKDVTNFRSYMDTVINYQDQDRNLSFFEKLGAVNETAATLFYDKKSKKMTPVVDWATTYNKSHSNLENADQLLELYNNHKTLLNSTYDRTRLISSKKFDESENTKNAIADIFVNDIDKKHLPRELWYGEMQKVLQRAEKRLQENGDLYGNNKQKMRLFVRSLADSNDLSQLFKEGNDYRPALMQAYANMLGVSIDDLGDKGYRFANSLYNSPNLELWSAERSPEGKEDALSEAWYKVRSFGSRLLGGETIK